MYFMLWQTFYKNISCICREFLPCFLPVQCQVCIKTIQKRLKDIKDYIHRTHKQKHWGLKHYCSLNHSIEQPFLKNTFQCIHWKFQFSGKDNQNPVGYMLNEVGEEGKKKKSSCIASFFFFIY